LNYVYEFTSFCTSIIVKLDNGTIVHERNLDFDFAADMKEITYIAKFYKNDKYIYESIMFAGTSLSYTGIREGAFSISENQRNPEETTEALLLNFALIFTGLPSISWLIRDTLTNCEDYACAYKKLLTDKVIAPGYLIVAGVKDYEGALITRDRFGPAHVDNLSADKWYLL
jgi:N-acylethanolamine-hydrolysing acid amidase